MDRVLFAAGLKPAKSRGDLSTQKEYPTDANAYELLEDCGRGVSATVHRARVKEGDRKGEIVAVKKLNLESINCNLDEIIHEAQTMKQYNHPNVLPLYCSFVQNEDLWMVMPYIAGGSILNIMKYACPDGLEEMTIATIMKEVLKALDYVHKHGGIHRDIKAGNILLDDDGQVKLADFGVAATTERGGSWNSSAHQRHTFVGTPCWMAPEVMEQTQGYDSSADIWSFGITLLEMAHGHAPFAKFPPMKVLLMTLQNPPPTLDDLGKKHYSKHMKEVVSKCLNKDPKLRPKAEQLLDHKFFRQAKDEDYLKRCLLAGLPQLTERVKLIRQGKAATSAEDNDRKAERSAEEYAKGVSAWNFDMARLKAQALQCEDEPGPTVRHDLIPSMSPVLEADSNSLAASLCTSPEISTAPSLTSNAVSRTGTFPSEQIHQALNDLQPPEEVVVIPEMPRRPSNGKLSSVFASFGASSAIAQALPPLPRGPSPSLDSPSPPLASIPMAVSMPTSQSRSNLTQMFSDPHPGDLPPLEQAISACIAPTPKVKKTNRFKVYEGSDDVPPMSPVTNEKAISTHVVDSRHMLSSLENGISDRTGIDRTSAELRVAEDTSARQSIDEKIIVEKVDEEGSAAGKRKGRFIIKEEDMAIKGSARMSGLTMETSKMRASDSRSSLTSPTMSGPTPSSGSMMPMLTELLEHSNQQSRALQRALAVMESFEKTGKVAWPQMARSVSSSRPASILEWRENLLTEVDSLRERVAELEKKVKDLTEENARLKAAQSGQTE